MLRPSSAFLNGLTSLWLLPLCLAFKDLAVDNIKQEIRIPNTVTLTKEDTYVCTTVKLPSQPLKLVGVEPQASMDVVHHILLFGCNSPHVLPQDGQPQPAWECGAVCTDSYQIMYGWGRNAPQLKLPEGVGFSVGDQSAIKYIVAQVHFLSKERPAGDASGVTLVLRPHAVPFSAGVIAFATGFSIPPKNPSFLVENECCYDGHQPLTTFAMRVHTHSLGKNVYMTRETWNHSGQETLGSRSPQLPQSFVPVSRSTIYPGDKLKVTCDFDSTSRTTTTNSGGTHHDEMCNMYMMVFSWQPFIAMCSGHFGLGDNSPGALPRSASFITDPSPFWNPPNPANNKLGEMSGLSMAEDSALWGLYRGDRIWDSSSFDGNNRITATSPISQKVVVRMESDTGRVLSAWGQDIFYMPHMLTIDREKNVWVVDCGLHQVLKFTQSGQQLMSLGTKLEPGSDSAHFCKPTKVAILRDGTVLVADGYCNSRIVKFSKEGVFLAEAQVNQGSVIHHLLLDECSNLVYVASRENGLVIAFSIDKLEEKQRISLSSNGRIWSLLTRPNGGVLALTWDLSQPARLVNVLAPNEKWQLPSSLDKQYPHEAVFGPAPLALSGPAERLLALYIVPTCPTKDCSRLQRFILVPQGRSLPAIQEVVTRGPSPLPRLPPVVSLSGGDEKEEVNNGDMNKSGPEEEAVPGEEDEGGDKPVVDAGEDPNPDKVVVEDNDQMKKAAEEEVKNEEIEEEEYRLEEERAEKEFEKEEEEASKEAETQKEQEETAVAKLVAEEEAEAEAEAVAEAEAEAGAEAEAEAEPGAEAEAEAGAEAEAEAEASVDAHATEAQAKDDSHPPDVGAAGSVAIPYGSGVAEVVDVTHVKASGSVKVIMLVVLATLMASFAVFGALFVMRKYATPSAKAGSAGEMAGFKPLTAPSKKSGKKKPIESIAEMLSNSETLEFEADVEATGTGWQVTPFSTSKGGSERS
ncbi:hypothetical protein CEUSTIGMA_g8901.t1 [Chlamydomonas eustigma]|uniref:Peptidylglycine monooxygenase n=1 Tax=Chlamydomonas eustigma TaxID=1157962 RepID=A0A250XEX9_9CHLO|nr:hypothetical protein CEUSTIGMA_g8901.t1 [Chlamydomonas eustigma]|eukprot:GAX81472.1 hypothetical protein CEUSTIGMA_g8901.t1 [Chlamydomonas eustigma]